MAHEVLKGAPVSAKAQTEANETGGPCPGKYGPPTTKGDFMEFEEKLEAAGATPKPDGVLPPCGAGGNAAQTLRFAVRKVLAQSGMTQDRMARNAGVSGSALSQWLRGQYGGNNEALEERISAWLAEPQNNVLDRCETAPTWVPTPTGEAIERVLTYARTTPSIGVVYGGAGVGKTTALKRYASDYTDAWYVKLQPTSSTIMGALRAVYEAIAARNCNEIRVAEISREIEQLLRWRHSAGALLVIDESQGLTFEALEELRSIHDSTGMGLVLAGNEKVYSNMIGGTRRADFAQLFSRVGRNLRLDRPTAEDVDAILKAWHIEGPKEREFCQQKASLPGALREMTKLLSAAAIAAHAMGGPIDIKVLRAAWREVGGSQ